MREQRPDLTLNAMQCHFVPETGQDAFRKILQMCHVVVMDTRHLMSLRLDAELSKPQFAAEPVESFAVPPDPPELRNLMRYTIMLCANTAAMVVSQEKCASLWADKQKDYNEKESTSFSDHRSGNRPK